MSEQIVRYIEQYRGTYTREAINKSLLAEGYTPADIQAAWQEVESRSRQGGDNEAPGEPVRPWKASRQPVFWLALVTTFVVIQAALSMFLFGYIGTLWSLGMTLVLLFVVLLAGIILLRRNRAVGLGLLYGLLWSVLLPVILLLAVAGICLAGGVRL